jgi:hypothetical protein
MVENASTAAPAPVTVESTPNSATNATRIQIVAQMITSVVGSSHGIELFLT